MGFPQKLLSFSPPDASVGNGNAVSETPWVFPQGLLAFLKVTLQHYTRNAWILPDVLVHDIT